MRDWAQARELATVVARWGWRRVWRAAAREEAGEGEGWDRVREWKGWPVRASLAMRARP